MIALTLVHVREGRRGEVNEEYGRIRGKEEDDPDYGGMVQPTQHHNAPRVKGVEWR